MWELKGACRLISRKHIQYKSFAPLATAISGLRVENAILDGELVALGSDGRSQFMDLMRRRTQNALYYVFDLIWLDGQDLRPLPLLDRKAALRQILKLSRIPAILYADHVAGIGFLERAERNPRLDTLLTLSKGLGISVSELLQGLENRIQALSKKSRPKGLR